MKKSLIALAVMAATGAAHAQSQVTLAGVVDQAFYSVTQENRAGTGKVRQNAFGEGSWAGSRIRFSGSEKLSGGMSAVFWLEQGIAVGDGNGFNYRNGGNAAQFTNGLGMTQQNRQSYVGLNGGFGTVRLGRLYTAGYDLWTNNGYINGEFTGTVNATGAITARTRGIGYLSPTMSGLSFYVTYGASNNDVMDVEATQAQVNGRNNSESKLITGYARYVAGPLHLGAIYEKLDEACSLPTTAAGAAATTAFPAGAANIPANFFGIPAAAQTACNAGGASSNFTGLLGEYDLKMAKVGLIIGDKTVQALTTGVKTDTKWNQLNVKVPFGKQWEGRVTYNTLKSDAAGATTQDLKGQFFNVNYKLSNRTIVYASMGSQKDEKATDAIGVKEKRSAIGVFHSF